MKRLLTAIVIISSSLALGGGLCSKKSEHQGTVNVGNHATIPTMVVTLNPINDDGSVDAVLVSQPGDLTGVTFSVSVRGEIVERDIPLTTLSRSGLVVGGVAGVHLERMDDDEDDMQPSSPVMALTAGGQRFFYQIPAIAQTNSGDLVRFDFQKPSATSVSYQGNASRDAQVALDEQSSGDTTVQALYLAQVVHTVSKDGETTIVTTTDYDLQGNQTRIRKDEQGDGTVDATVTYDYDLRGNRTRISDDRNGDGVLDTVIRNIYNTGGKISRIEADLDADGTPDNIVTHDYHFHLKNALAEPPNATDNNTMQGNLVGHSYYLNLLQTQQNTTQDHNADGIPDEVEITSYDADGKKIQVEHDLEADGTIDYVTFYHYNVLGYKVKREHDAGADGTIDLRVFYSYDGNGHKTKTEHDMGADGVIDYIALWDYQRDEETITRIRVDFDYDADGMTDAIYQTFYNLRGQETHIENDHDADGVADFISRSDYDDQGALVRHIIDNNADGIAETIESYLYHYNPQPKQQQPSKDDQSSFL